MAVTFRYSEHRKDSLYIVHVKEVAFPEDGIDISRVCSLLDAAFLMEWEGEPENGRAIGDFMKEGPLEDGTAYNVNREYGILFQKSFLYGFERFSLTDDSGEKRGNGYKVIGS